ncbi:NIF domain protein [Aspergillus vadensis CBS 113365]|uniref:HAD-like protein n=1 Tax=Aspergillus vadensis (strain CBS 113365 / IMI 142717 / IBT 24658) TaxID=1448311 RepID=A0A319BSE1_ASPVC|nr:HAD-like protein [Aspergillus vadensis CBS 113365]PYH66118.1 HAD-like protein [Aspergillus vadensis CBS 113365]
MRNTKRNGTEDSGTTAPGNAPPSARPRQKLPRRSKQLAEKNIREEMQSQASQSANTASYAPGHPSQNSFGAFDNFNLAPMFLPFQNGTAASNETFPGFQQPFWQLPLEQQQQLLQAPLGEPTNPSFGFPPLNDMSAFPGGLPPMFPPAFMNFAPTNPLMTMPPFGPMAFPAAGSAGVNTRNMSSQVPSPRPGSSSKARASPRPRSKKFESPTPPKRALPTPAYIEQSSKPAKRNSWKQPLLVILDLNGTLVHRPDRYMPPRFKRRAGLDIFIQTLMQKYKVMIWSSARPPTVDGICRQLFINDSRTQIVAEWHREHFNLTPQQYDAKIQVYKTLSTVWADEKVQASYPSPESLGQSVPATFQKTRWDQTNTILIDDTRLKASSEPSNLLEIPTFDGHSGAEDAATLTKVLQMLEELSLHDDVSQVLHKWYNSIPKTGNLCLDIKLQEDAEAQQQPEITQQPQPQPKPNDVPLTPAEIAEARKQRRKARKREKTAEKARARQIQKQEDRLAAKAKKQPPPPPTSIPVAAAVSSTVDETNTVTPHTYPSSFPPPSPSSPSSDSSPGGTAIPSGLDLNENASNTLRDGDASDRSPSPAASTQSENYLLDRLEESLKT